MLPAPPAPESLRPASQPTPGPRLRRSRPLRRAARLLAAHPAAPRDGKGAPGRTCVQADVHFEAPRGGEALHAVLALERLDARVGLDVGGQRALHGKGAETLRALEGLLVGVNADVAHQVARLPELLGAVGTHMPPDTVLLADRTWGRKTTKPVQRGLFGPRAF